MGRNGLLEDRARVSSIGPSNAELDRTNLRLREVARIGGLRAFAEEGRVILDDVFGGDVRAWEDRSPAKMNSIRRLAERPTAPYGKDALTKRVRVCVALEALPIVWDCDALSASHVVEVLRLPPAERASMLTQAQSARWSVRQLHDAVVAERRSRGERRGRRVWHALQKAIVQLRKSERLGSGTLAECADADHAIQLDLEAASAQLEETHRAIQRRIATLVLKEGAEVPVSPGVHKAGASLDELVPAAAS
jgi:hypothetical protein